MPKESFENKKNKLKQEKDTSTPVCRLDRSQKIVVQTFMTFQVTFQDFRLNRLTGYGYGQISQMDTPL